MRTLPMFLIISLFLSNTINAQSTAETSEDVRQAIQQNFQQMGAAMAASDPDALADHFSEEAFLKFPGQEPLNGREAIARAHEQMIADGIKVKPTSTEVELSGDFAYEMGTYELLNEQDQKVDSGHYATIWKKEDGEWKIYRDVISSSPAR